MKNLEMKKELKTRVEIQKETLHDSLQVYFNLYGKIRNQLCRMTYSFLNEEQIEDFDFDYNEYPTVHLNSFEAYEEFAVLEVRDGVVKLIGLDSSELELPLKVEEKS